DLRGELDTVSTTITHPGGTITPTAVEGYAAARPVRTVIHDVIGEADTDTTFRPAGLRAGELVLVLDSADAAFAAFAALAEADGACTLTNTDVPALDMTFVVGDGDLGVEQDVADVLRATVPLREKTARPAART